MAINLTFEEAAEKLQNLYKSAEYNELIKKRSQTTYLEAMHKQRSETIFSSLIQWIIENPDFNKESDSSPLMYMLRLLALTAIKQEKGGIPSVEVIGSNGSKTEEERPLMNYALRNSIQANDIVISNIKVETEEKTDSDKGKGRIDLTIKCDVKSKEEEDSSKGKHKKGKKKDKIDLKLRIILENKVDSVEREGKDKNGNKIKIQCKNYFEHFNDPQKKCNEGIDSNVFVFLSIDPPKDISSPHFIKITYQDLLDNVLNLIMVQSVRYSESSVRYLRDFIETITTLKTGGNKSIAIASDTKQLLTDFYENNKEIINAAVLAGYYNTHTHDTKQLLCGFFKGNIDIIINAIAHANCEDIDKRIFRIIKQFQGDKYYISYKGVSKKEGVYMNKVVYEAIQLMLSVEENTKPVDIEKALGFHETRNKFWERLDPNQEPTSGFTDPIDFGNGVKYLVHTQKYKTTTPAFINMLDKLIDAKFDIQ